MKALLLAPRKELVALVKEFIRLTVPGVVIGLIPVTSEPMDLSRRARSISWILPAILQFSRNANGKINY